MVWDIGWVVLERGKEGICFKGDVVEEIKISIRYCDLGEV